MYQVTPAPYWRAERSRRRQEAYDEQGKGQIEHAEGHFTGASGGTVYGGDAFPEGFYGNIFTGEVAGLMKFPLRIYQVLVWLLLILSVLLRRGNVA
ncbi:hypothetical protein [Sphingobacterium hotanense]|uniref:hypothetical protein n=1 Tax=Sphingobacterium hotanense TaxID=649196 RepID=UPI0021A51C17|nr:hypothetical protein [Sphingobacterium hotanense]MCT1524121.1 hypothetical protein [Sphingobacterium hotanense]